MGRLQLAAILALLGLASMAGTYFWGVHVGKQAIIDKVESQQVEILKEQLDGVTKTLEAMVDVTRGAYAQEQEARANTEEIIRKGKAREKWYEEQLAKDASCAAWDAEPIRCRVQPSETASDAG